MATSIVSGPIDNNNDGAPFDDLALKVYSGMLMEAFNAATVTRGRHVERMISSGKSAQFPAHGRVGIIQHTRGTEIAFEQVNSSEIVISIEDMLLAPIFVDVLDELKAHFDIRRSYATQQGQALAEAADERVLGAFVKAAQTATPTVTGLEAGTTDIQATIGTDVAVLRGAVYDAAQALDDNKVPSSERYLFLQPAQFYLLLEDGEFLDTDFGGAGSKATAVMRQASDFEVVKTVTMPQGNETADTTWPTNLRLNYAAVVAVAGHKSAAGTVTLKDIAFEVDYDSLRQGHRLIAKFAKGFGVLRPEAAVSFQSA